MKNSELVDYLKKGNIVIPLFMLENYKSFGVNMEEFVFLMYLYNCGNKFLFDPSKFSSELGIKLAEIMNYIGKLSEQHLITIETLKNDKGLMEEVVVLDDFYNKLSLIVIDNINSKDSKDSNIFGIVEQEFGRTLSPIEYEIIKAWLDNNIKEELIKEALKEATFNGVSNLRYIDKILYEWGKNGISNVEQLGEYRKKKNRAKNNDNNNDTDVDLDIVDWNWFDDE